MIAAIVSGDGDSAEDPIRFEPCDRATRIMSEGAYISQRFGKEGVDWNRGMLLHSPGFISQWNIDLADGTSHAVYFDTSASLETE